MIVVVVDSESLIATFDSKSPNQKNRMKLSNQKTKRPHLQTLPMAEVKIGPGSRLITLSPGQWDPMLDEAYSRGWILLEIVDEIPTRAYRLPEHRNN